MPAGALMIWKQVAGAQIRNAFATEARPFPGVIAISGVFEDGFMTIWLQWIFLQLKLTSVN